VDVLKLLAAELDALPHVLDRVLCLLVVASNAVEREHRRHYARHDKGHDEGDCVTGLRYVHLHQRLCLLDGIFQGRYCRRGRWG